MLIGGTGMTNIWVCTKAPAIVYVPTDKTKIVWVPSIETTIDCVPQIKRQLFVSSQTIQ